MEHLCPLVHNAHSALAFDGTAWWNANQNWNSSFCIFVNMYFVYLCLCICIFPSRPFFVGISQQPSMEPISVLPRANIFAGSVKLLNSLYLLENVKQERHSITYEQCSGQSLQEITTRSLKSESSQESFSRSRTIFPTTVAWDRRWPCQILIPRTSNDFRHP